MTYLLTIVDAPQDLEATVLPEIELVSIKKKKGKKKEESPRREEMPLTDRLSLKISNRGASEEEKKWRPSWKTHTRSRSKESRDQTKGWIPYARPSSPISPVDEEVCPICLS